MSKRVDRQATGGRNVRLAHGEDHPVPIQQSTSEQGQSAPTVGAAAHTRRDSIPVQGSSPASTLSTSTLPELTVVSNSVQPKIEREDLQKRDWNAWLDSANKRQVELTRMRAEPTWTQAPTRGWPLPGEVMASILDMAVLASAKEVDPRHLQRQMHATGMLSKYWSAWWAEHLSQLPKGLRVQAGLSQYLMLKDRSPGMNERFSRFIASRLGLNDPLWDQRQLPPDCEPRWAHMKSHMPLTAAEQKLWCDLIRLAPENLQELTVDAHTELESETIDTLAQCSQLHTVHLEQEWHDFRPPTDKQWLARIAKLEKLYVEFACPDLDWIPETARKGLKFLALDRMSHARANTLDMSMLPPDTEVALVITTWYASDTVPSLHPQAWHKRIMGVSFRFLTHGEFVTAFPAKLKKLALIANNAVLEAALKHFKELAELAVTPHDNATLEPLRTLVKSKECVLRKLTVHIQAENAEDMLVALRDNKSVEELVIGSLTTAASIAKLLELMKCHPMTTLTVWLGKRQTSRENVQKILEALQKNKSLRSLSLKSPVNPIQAVHEKSLLKNEIDKLPELLSSFQIEDTSLTEFSALFESWSIQRRSLAFNKPPK